MALIPLDTQFHRNITLGEEERRGRRRLRDQWTNEESHDAVAGTDRGSHFSVHIQFPLIILRVHQNNPLATHVESLGSDIEIGGLERRSCCSRRGGLDVPAGFPDTHEQQQGEEASRAPGGEGGGHIR